MDDGNAQAHVLTLVVLRVADLERSRSFYECLGLHFTEEQHGSGPRHLSTTVGGTVLELYPTGTATTTGTRIGLAVADLDQVVDRVGDAVVGQRTDRGTKPIVVVDPDGHKIELTPHATVGERAENVHLDGGHPV
jgi:catechol 2,3-dioxygenase-like lactoylglutathione lyase family enzyme